MKKPASLRAAIEAMNPDLKDNPDKMIVIVRDGRIALRAGPAKGYQYAYRVEIDIIGFTGNSNHIILPVTLWLRENQPDLLLSPQTADKVINFSVDILDAGTSDLSLSVDLTESISVEATEDGYKVNYRPEAPPFDYPLSDPASILHQIFDPQGRITPPVIEG